MKINFINLFIIVCICSINDVNAESKLVPPPTDRNFSIVGAFSWMSMAENSPAAYNLELSAHYIKPAFALDIYYEKGLQDWFRSSFIKKNQYTLVNDFINNIEVNCAVTLGSKISKKGSLFYRGSSYSGGTKYDVYSRGEGDAALYYQIRFGGSKRHFTYMSEGFEAYPELNNITNYTYTYISYKYPKIDMVSIFDNMRYHVGLGTSKIYLTESPGRSSGTDRIGVVKFYADLLYSPDISYHFLEGLGNAPFTGIVPDQVFQKIGFRMGTETNRLNAFSGYWGFEMGLMTGLRPAHAQTGDQFLFYATLKFGLETGWPLFNSKYK